MSKANLFQVIIEEGQVVPADARLICDYDNPEAFSEYKALMEQETGGDTTEKHEEDEDEEEEKHHGVALVAADQSAITGESLAVDKFMGDTCYYTTGCKRGKAYAVVTAHAKISFVGRTASLVEGAKDQGHFKAIMYLAFGFGRLLDSPFLDRWLLSSLEARNPRVELYQSVTLRPYPLDRRCSRGSSCRHHHYVGRGSCISR